MNILKIITLIFACIVGISSIYRQLIVTGVSLGTIYLMVVMVVFFVFVVLIEMPAFQSKE